jgi:hypothetical protein
MLTIMPIVIGIAYLVVLGIGFYLMYRLVKAIESIATSVEKSVKDK